MTTINRGKIRFLRGKKDGNEDMKLYPGQPFYDTDTGYFYVAKYASDTLGDVTAVKASSADNVSSTINNKNISDIFETNGLTVKNATNATKADTATNSIKVQNVDLSDDDSQAMFDNSVIVERKKLIWSTNTPRQPSESNPTIINSITLDAGIYIFEFLDGSKKAELRVAVSSSYTDGDGFNPDDLCKVTYKYSTSPDPHHIVQFYRWNFSYSNQTLTYTGRQHSSIQWDNVASNNPVTGTKLAHENGPYLKAIYKII